MAHGVYREASLTESNELDDSRRAEYRLIARQADGRTNVLVVELPGGERLLPVFSADAEAEMFAWLGGLDGFLDDDWYPRRTQIGELLAMLIGPRRSVRRIALDPSPEITTATGGDEIELVCVSRKDFVERLLSERRAPQLTEANASSGADVRQARQATQERAAFVGPSVETVREREYNCCKSER